MRRNLRLAVGWGMLLWAVGGGLLALLDAAYIYWAQEWWRIGGWIIARFLIALWGLWPLIGVRVSPAVNYRIHLTLAWVALIGGILMLLLQTIVILEAVIRDTFDSYILLGAAVFIALSIAAIRWGNRVTSEHEERNA